MVTWELLGDSADASGWDRNLSAGADANVFQSYGWGEFKRVWGWCPMRWIARDQDHAVVGMVQILTKALPAWVQIGWAPGGPVFLFKGTAGLDPGDTVPALVGAIQASKRRVCVRFDSQVCREGALAYAFNQTLVRPLVQLNSGYSIRLDLGQSLDVLQKRMTPKHRYYVKKALGENLRWKAGSDQEAVQDLVQLHTEMVRAKQLESGQTRPNEIGHLCRVLGEGAVVFTGYAGDVPVTSCLVLRFGRKAFYWMAATGMRGRELSASYAMLYRLLEYLQGQGVTEFDFGGIDPRSAAAEGVNHFKRGFGGEIVEHLGEWEWSNSMWLRLGMNLAVRLRGVRL
jgi:lipid II:glycine glycyltransferase (peptidoglycan interpeptide bridge formation enzyme)